MRPIERDFIKGMMAVAFEENKTRDETNAAAPQPMPGEAGYEHPEFGRFVIHAKAHRYWEKIRQKSSDELKAITDLAAEIARAKGSMVEGVPSIQREHMEEAERKAIGPLTNAELLERVERAERERDECKRQRDNLKYDKDQLLQASVGNYWAWQNDGSDHIESITCPVMIQPRDLEGIIAAKKVIAAQQLHCFSCGVLWSLETAKEKCPECHRADEWSHEWVSQRVADVTAKCQEHVNAKETAERERDRLQAVCAAKDKHIADAENILVGEDADFKNRMNRIQAAREKLREAIADPAGQAYWDQLQAAESTDKKQSELIIEQRDQIDQLTRERDEARGQVEKINGILGQYIYSREKHPQAAGVCWQELLDYTGINKRDRLPKEGT